MFDTPLTAVGGVTPCGSGCRPVSVGVDGSPKMAVAVVSAAVASSVEAGSVAADLHEGLDVLGVEGPVVLVGHSLGAGYARVFAAAYPDRVAGLVLLDPVHEEQLDRLPAQERASFEEAQQQFEVAPLLARLGVFGLSDPQEDVVASLPELLDEVAG
ncbi:MAG: alpha/beta hydrolase [Nitriliruptor sp.]|nr:MAG: alpha/beta hydrolase [Nitriliruptor sp.]